MELDWLYNHVHVLVLVLESIGESGKWDISAKNSDFTERVWAHRSQRSENIFQNGQKFRGDLMLNFIAVMVVDVMVDSMVVLPGLKVLNFNQSKNHWGSFDYFFWQSEPQLSLRLWELEVDA